jgi:metacaspase-1
VAKRAVLIGINEYQIPGANLRGCVNDVKGIKSALVELHGFAAKDVTVLTDKDATKKKIEKAVEGLVRSSKKGDVALLHYSGHGSNVPDDGTDEEDGRDEILCPTDLNWEDPMRDDWLRSTLDGLKPGVNFTAIMDCCHSGTNTRALLSPDAPVIPRYLPSPWGIMRSELGRSAAPRTRARRAPSRKREISDIVNVDLPEVLITGCRDTQTSADAFIDGSFNGALTFALVEAMRSSKGPITYRDLHKRATAAMKKRKFEQVPQLEGRSDAFDRPLFMPFA